MPDIAPIQSEAFVLSIAEDLFTVEKAAEWFETLYEQRRAGPATDARVEYLILAREANAGEGGTVSLVEGGVASMLTDVLPALISNTLVGRVHWRQRDLGRSHRLSVNVTSEEGTEEVSEVSHTFIADPPARGGDASHENGIMPLLFSIDIVHLFERPGEHQYVFTIDGFVAGVVPFMVMVR
jgi:hypothetical protein